MSKNRSLPAALALLALIPSAAAIAQTRETRADAVSYSRSFARGVESFDAGRYEEALEAFLVAVAANPQDADALFNVGVTYERLGRPLEASAAFRSTLELRPANAKARARLCSALVAAGQFWEGVEACGRAVRAGRGEPELFVLYGRAFAGAGLYDQAAEAYKQAIRLKPDAAEYHLALGLAFERLGEYRDALDSLERAARLAPDSQEARAEHGRVTAELSDLESGLEGVGGYDRLMNVGHAYRLKGWYGKAAAVYTLAASRRPRDAAARYYQGLAYYSMNRYQRALDSYRRALALDPKMAEARRDLGWLKAYVSSGEGGERGRRVPPGGAPPTSHVAVEARSDAATRPK
jgi:tetratricopeptide (TPR) repeat protein